MQTCMPASLSPPPISERELRKIQSWMKQWAGITLADNKRTLICSRLNARLRELGLSSYSEYVTYVADGRNAEERQRLIDALTTNETYFFREPKHFEFLRSWLSQSDQHREGRRPVKIWCAAASSGEEPYSLAMTLDDCLGNNGWRMLASDINQQVLTRAKLGCYDADYRGEIPQHLKERYLLRGVRSQAGKVMVAPQLKQRITFQRINLNEELAFREQFDVVFIRNVLIYFDSATKTEIIRRILPHVRDHGCIVVSHSETLYGVSPQLHTLQPSVYEKLPAPDSPLRKNRCTGRPRR